MPLQPTSSRSLCVRRLTRQVPLRIGAPLLLDAIDCELPPGARVALQGKSGAGKSLLLRAIIGLDPLDAGEVDLDGRRLTCDWICQFRSVVAYVPQRAALQAGTVRENLQRAQRLAVHKRTRPQLDLAGATVEAGYAKDLLDRDVRLLSGGELQWVNLLRTLQFDPRILLLDEPTASMDAATIERVESWLLGWQAADSQRAWIWVSHDREQCARIANSYWQMDRGRLAVSAVNPSSKV